MILHNVEKITEVCYRSVETRNWKQLSSVPVSTIKSTDHPVCKSLVH